MAAMTERFGAISQEMLLALAGKAALARGLAYYKEGRVALMSAGAERAQASVRGTETYRVDLRARRGGLTGTCECPAFDDSGFCKHMVATALAASEAGAADRIGPLREHLVAQGAEALADRLLRLAERDVDLLASIEREIADTTESDEALLARYRTAIDQATDPRGGVDYWGAGAYAEEIASVIEPLRTLARSGRARPALELAEHLLEAIEEGMGEADDSEGEIYDVGLQAVALHLELCRVVRPDPVELAGTLFELQMDGVTDLFTDADETYAEVLGLDGLAEFHRQAREAWTALPAAKRNQYDGRRSVLKSILDRAAERAGDVDARIALRQAELAEPAAYREIADICLAAGRQEEALRWIEEGLWCFEDRPDEPLQRSAADLMARAGRRADAEALLWRVFERRPTLATYAELAALAGAQSPGARAAAFLREAAARAAKAGPHLNEPAMTLFDLQMELGAVDDAWETVQAWGVGEGRLGALADRSIASHSDLAARTYQFLAESRISLGGAGNYDEAITLIRRRALARGDDADQAAYVEDLKTRHKAKRTFVQRLQGLT
jgi:uncharacterized Zn finger protein